MPSDFLAAQEYDLHGLRLSEAISDQRRFSLYRTISLNVVSVRTT